MSDGQDEQPNNNSILTEDIKQELSDLPEEKRKRLVGFFLKQEIQHSGPLPIPRHLREYNEIIPNGAERIMKAYEAETSFRHEETKKYNQRAHFSRILGQTFGFLLAISAFLFSGYAVHTGHSGTAITTVIFSIVSLAGVFLGERYFLRNEPDED